MPPIFSSASARSSLYRLLRRQEEEAIFAHLVPPVPESLGGYPDEGAHQVPSKPVSRSATTSSSGDSSDRTTRTFLSGCSTFSPAVGLPEGPDEAGHVLLVLHGDLITAPGSHQIADVPHPEGRELPPDHPVDGEVGDPYLDVDVEPPGST